MTNQPTPKPEGYVALRKGLTPKGIREPGNVRGHFRFTVKNPDGSVAQEVESRNLILNLGLNYLKELLLDSVTPSALTRLTHIAIGTDGTAEAPTDVGLGAEHARRAFDSYTAGGVGVASVATEFPAATGPATLAEAALYDAPAAGNVFNRVTFTAVTIDALQTLLVTFTVTFTDA